MEERRLLAVVAVSNPNDVLNGDTSSIAALVASDGGDGISLREAVLAANADAAADTIDFAATGTIQLTNVGHVGEIVINKNLTINGPGASLLTIRAFAGTASSGDGSRIFNLDDANTGNAANVAINGLTLAGGDASGSGGAILANENLTLTDSVITGNASANPYAAQGGGGIYSGYGGDLTVVRCVIADNSTAIEGGGIRKRGAQLIVQDSQIEGNAAGRGGGISAADGVTVEILRTSINSNASHSTSYYGGGGLLLYSANVELRDSLISGNSSLFVGGGIDAFASRNFVMIGSTVSGNSSGSDGGALRLSSSSTWEIASSTITANIAPEGFTGGVYVTGSKAASRVFRSSIIAGNANSDVDGDATLFQSVGYNLIGTGSAVGVFNQPGDQTGVTNPLLAPLADNGGPTWTHALLPGSPALDAGDPAAVAGVNGVPVYDQRGNPFGRVFDGDGLGGARIDIGAYESQPIPPAVIGDYNADGMTDAADYVLWRKTVEASVTPFAGADGDGDGVIGQGDYGVWRGHFGQMVPAAALGSGGIASGELGVGSRVLRD